MFYELLRELDPYATAWTVFKKQLDDFFSANCITGEEEKRALLLTTLNQDTYELLLTFCYPSTPETTTYDTLMSLLDHHFCDSFFLRRFEFFNASRSAGETLEEWVARVKSLARECDHGAHLDELCKRVFLCGLNSPGLLELLGDEAETDEFEVVVDFVLKNRGLVDERFGYCWGMSCHEPSYDVFWEMERYYYFDPYNYLRGVQF